MTGAPAHAHTNPMGSAFPITLRRTFSSMPEVTLMSWRDVIDLYERYRHLPLKSATRPDEKPPDLPLIAFGAFDQLDRKGPGCRGTNLNPEGIHALALDYDDITPQQAIETLARAKQFSPEGLAHSTWQHGLAMLTGEYSRVRIRIVMPLGAPVSRHSWEALWTYANRALGGLADAQCKNIDRFYYVPCVNLDAPSWVLQDGACWMHTWGT